MNVLVLTRAGESAPAAPAPAGKPRRLPAAAGGSGRTSASSVEPRPEPVEWPAAVFERAGDAVSRVESVDAAVETVKVGAADVIVIDLDDEAAALEACERLRAGSPEHLPIAARLSVERQSPPGPDAARKLAEAGADFAFAEARELEGAAPLLRRLARRGNGARNRLCEAPLGPSRQTVPGTVSPLAPFPPSLLVLVQAPTPQADRIEQFRLV